MRKIIVAGAALALLSAPAARAQGSDVGASLASGVEELAQAFGQATFAGPSLFVTAKGQARLPAPIADAYSVTIQGKDASAVVATRSRDAKVDQVLAAARRSGVTVEQSGTDISLETDAEAQQARMREQSAAIRAHAQNPGVAFAPPETDPTPPKVFIAKASLRFRAPATANLAAFLDAIRAAGVDEISRGVNGPTNPFLPRVEAFGFGSVETLDDSIWNAAGAQAIQKARIQAQALAAASGRALGPVKGVIVLSRGAEGDLATESVAVRFALVDAAH